MRLRVDQEHVVATVPRDVDEADEQTVGAASTHPAEAVRPDPVPPTRLRPAAVRMGRARPARRPSAGRASVGDPSRRSHPAGRRPARKAVPPATHRRIRSARDPAERRNEQHAADQRRPPRRSHKHTGDRKMAARPPARLVDPPRRAAHLVICQREPLKTAGLRCCHSTARAGPCQRAATQRALEVQNEQSPS